MYVHEFSGGTAIRINGRKVVPTKGGIPIEILGQHGERIAIIINEGSADIHRAYRPTLVGIFTTARSR